MKCQRCQNKKSQLLSCGHCGRLLCDPCAADGCCGFIPAEPRAYFIEGQKLITQEADEDGDTILEPTPLSPTNEIQQVWDDINRDLGGES